MPQIRSFALPDVGEGLTEAEILHWLVAAGDTVEVNTVLVEIETAKASVELPSPYAGVIETIHVAEGAIVPVGTPLVSIAVAGTDGDDAEPDSSATAPQREAVLVGYGVEQGSARRRRRVPAAASATTAVTTPAAPHRTEAPSTARARAKPPVRRLARELGVDLRQVPPTGTQGEVTRGDVVAAHAAAALPAGTRVPVRGVRRAMATAMTQSAATAPQASVWLDVDLSAALARLTAVRAQPEAEGVRLTPLVLVAQALVRAVREQPLLHATWHEEPDGPVLVLPERVGLGIATDTPRGLLVPVVPDPPADDLVALGRVVQRVVDVARVGDATPADLTGGTVTLTNVGVLGVDGGVPILTPGQSAILAMGRTADRPWVVDGQVVARPVLQLTLTFDHRVLDGAQAAAALSSIAAALSA